MGSHSSIRTGYGISGAPPGGFTLLELVIVLFVIALAGIVVYPDLKPMFEGARLTAVVRETAAFLDGARNDAVLAGRTLTVSLDEDGTAIVVTRGNGDGEAVNRLEIVGGGTPVVERLGMEPDEIRYFPGGSSSGGEIFFMKEGENVVSVRVGSFTGLAAVVEEER